MATKKLRTNYKNCDISLYTLRAWATDYKLLIELFKQPASILGLLQKEYNQQLVTQHAK
jgi:hypothetical protein